MKYTHDHKECLKHAAEQAHEAVQKTGARLTPLRQSVLDQLLKSHTARGAYAVLADLNKKAAKPLAPISVYRAIDFLVAHGLAHRIESLNAYIACTSHAHHHTLQLLVCEKCQTVQELDSAPLEKALHAATASHHFQASRTVLEVIGRCENCTSS